MTSAAARLTSSTALLEVTGRVTHFDTPHGMVRAVTRSQASGVGLRHRRRVRLRQECWREHVRHSDETAPPRPAASHSRARSLGVGPEMRDSRQGIAHFPGSDLVAASVKRIGAQIGEVLTRHLGLRPPPKAVGRASPGRNSAVSGGMRQRAAITIALACERNS